MTFFPIIWFASSSFLLKGFFLCENGFGANPLGTGFGANPLGTTHRHGFGADNVLEYKLVLADGRIAIVDKENTTILQKNEYGQK